MTERATLHPTPPELEVVEQPYSETDVSHRRFRKPAILQPFDPAETMSIVDAAQEAGISERQMRTWCPTHQIGRKIGGRYHVSRPLFSMYRDGDTGAHDDHLHGDRTSERVVGYMRRLGIKRD